MLPPFHCWIGLCASPLHMGLVHRSVDSSLALTYLPFSAMILIARRALKCLLELICTQHVLRKSKQHDISQPIIGNGGVALAKSSLI